MPELACTHMGQDARPYLVGQLGRSKTNGLARAGGAFSNYFSSSLGLILVNGSCVWR